MNFGNFIAYSVNSDLLLLYTYAFGDCQNT